MKFEVQISPNSRLIVEADPSGDGPIQICDRISDLSKHNLFVQPFSSPGDEAIDSRKDKIIEVFRMLGFADTQNPLLKQLERYYGVRLPFILNRLEQPTAHNEPAITRSLTAIGCNPGLESAVLRTIINRIDDEFPLTHRTEKIVGTHSWLSSGGSAPLSFTTAPLSLLPHYDSLFLPAKRTGSHIPFAIEDRTAFFPDHELPRPLSIISSLCRTGKGGPALDSLNQAAAMSLMTRNIARDITKARRTVERLSGLLPPAHQAFLGHSSINALLSIAAASLVAQAGSNAINFGVGLSDLTVAAAGSALGLGAWVSQRVAGAVHRTRIERDMRKLERAQSILDQTEQVPHTVLATVMLNHISQQNRFSKNAFPGPESESRWRSAFEGLGVADHHISHLLTLIPLEPYHGDPGNYEQITRRIFQEVEPEGFYLSHLEAAEANAQLLLAIDAANFFADITGLPLPSNAQLPLRVLLTRAQELRCDAGRVFPLIAATFENLRRSWKLSHEDWAFASRPVLAVLIIESEYMALRAREIAVEEVLRARCG